MSVVPPLDCRLADGAPPPSCGPVILVAADGITDDLDLQCRALGVRLSDRFAGGETRPLLLGVARPDRLDQGLRTPFCGFIELGAEGLLGVGLRCFETVRTGGFSLSLLTRSAYELDVTALVAKLFREGLGVPGGPASDQIEICLGEAVGNAVIHGNLGIPNHLRATSKGFERFRQIMGERMANPALAGRRVEVNVSASGTDLITVRVSDQGSGFDLARHMKRSVESEAKSGRGLGLIRRLCSSLLTEDDGRTLVMTFLGSGSAMA
jgi:anti-sigma regulatory factor (Ser/Thr protein kinase)